MNNIVYVGGAFDLLHPGHIHLLKHAKGLGDKLVVAVLSDNYVKSYKGEERPILPEGYRQEMVASLKYVDNTFISDESTYSVDNLEKVNPDVIVMGIENNMDVLRKKSEKIKEVLPDVAFSYLPRYKSEKISTSKIIQKISVTS